MPRPCLRCWRRRPLTALAGRPMASQDQLATLWISAGGAISEAAMASAIAMAESGGDQYSHSPAGDVGYWQINEPVWGALLATTDPLGNAKAAVQISHNGSNWRPWCTAWSDGACGTNGGTYEGSGSPYRKYLSGVSGIPSETPPAEGGQAVSPSFSLPQVDVLKGLRKAVMVVGGGLAVVIGLVIIANDLSGGDLAKSASTL